MAAANENLSILSQSAAGYSPRSYPGGSDRPWAYGLREPFREGPPGRLRPRLWNPASTALSREGAPLRTWQSPRSIIRGSIPCKPLICQSMTRLDCEFIDLRLAEPILRVPPVQTIPLHLQPRAQKCRLPGYECICHHGELLIVYRSGDKRFSKPEHIRVASQLWHRAAKTSRVGLNTLGPRVR